MCCFCFSFIYHFHHFFLKLSFMQLFFPIWIHFAANFLDIRHCITPTVYPSFVRVMKSINLAFPTFEYPLCHTNSSFRPILDCTLFPFFFFFLFRSKPARVCSLVILEYTTFLFPFDSFHIWFHVCCVTILTFAHFSFPFVAERVR